MWSYISLFPLMVSTFCVLCKESFPISRHEDIILCFLLALLFDLSHLDLQSILKLVFCLFDARWRSTLFYLFMGSLKLTLHHYWIFPTLLSFLSWIKWLSVQFWYMSEVEHLLWLVSICIYFSVNCPYFVTFLLGWWSFSFQFCVTLYTLEILALCDINCRDVCVCVCVYVYSVYNSQTFLSVIMRTVSPACQECLCFPYLEGL